MKIRCHKCKGNAELSSDYAHVSCKSCGLEMSYGDYVKEIAHTDPTYSDILGDYAGGLDAQQAGAADWD